MNQFLSNKIISGIVAVALLVGVGVLVSSGDTSSTTRNAALVVATPCTKPGQVTKVSKQSVVCAKTNTGSLWYATMKAKGKAQPCTKPGAIRKKSKIIWVCGVVKKKTLWQATRPLPPAVVASTTVIEPGASQPTPALDSTQVATPDVPVVADNTVLADTKIPEDKTVTQVIDDATTLAICASGGTCAVGDVGPGGGIVFYVATTPQTWGTYLEAAPTDYQVNGSRAEVEWGCQMRSTIARATEIGSGKANTATIRLVCPNAGTAADVANKYSTSTAAAGQWFLPSIDELNELCKIYSNTGVDTPGLVTLQNGCAGSTSPTGGFATGLYWSSSEKGPYSAWTKYFLYGNQRDDSKYSKFHVRPVRAFSATTPATTPTTIAPKVCTGSGDCNLRDIGPGGGIVFYVATTPFTCGENLTQNCTYLEAAIANGTAPSTWSPNTQAQWGCHGTSVSGTSLEIGTGRANTILITGASCNVPTSAASIAAAYNGGNKTDWFLPSRKELNALCLEFFNDPNSNYVVNGWWTAHQIDGCRGKQSAVTSATNVMPGCGFAAAAYWSSSGHDELYAWFQNFNFGSQLRSYKTVTCDVRPVRAF